MKRINLAFQPSLKNKILFGFILIISIVLSVSLYGSYTFKKLERKMEIVNEVYVPTLKALNQMESSFFLLESDLDKSLQEGILRPKETLESVLNSRFDFLQNLLKGSFKQDLAITKSILELSQSYKSCELVLNKVYDNWQEKERFSSELSEVRNDFRTRLKSISRELDRETRMESLAVQAEMNRLGIVLTIAIAFAFIIAFILAYGIAVSLKPLEVLASVLREISRSGLSESSVRDLSILPESNDEIGMLSKESYKMASSLLDNNKLLESQKQNLERAHSDLAKQNLELKKAQNKLLHTEKLGLVGKLAAQMAHEIRNPLNALNLHVEILEEQWKNESKTLDSLLLVRKEINRLISVTESYLDLARAPKLEKKAIQLNDVVEEMHELYEPVFREKGIFFTCDLGEIPAIGVDKSQIAQVLANLLKNAAEAFEVSDKKSGKFIRLITQFNKEKNEIALTIMDNGGGIPVEMQENIFSPFYTSKAQGTGLGLAHTKQVVESHGGEVGFDSIPSFGTKFTVVLPVQT